MLLPTPRLASVIIVALSLAAKNTLLGVWPRSQSRAIGTVSAFDIRRRELNACCNGLQQYAASASREPATICSY